MQIPPTTKLVKAGNAEGSSLGNEVLIHGKQLQAPPLTPPLTPYEERESPVWCAIGASFRRSSRRRGSSLNSLLRPRGLRKSLSAGAGDAADG